jgi:hypothetical protein
MIFFLNYKPLPLIYFLETSHDFVKGHTQQQGVETKNMLYVGKL